MNSSLSQVHSLRGFLGCVDFSGFTPGKKHFLFKSTGGYFSYLQPHSRFVSEQEVSFTGGPCICPPGVASRIHLQSTSLAIGLHCFRARVCQSTVALGISRPRQKPHGLPAKAFLLEQHGHPRSEMRQSNDYVYQPTRTLSSG